MMPSLDDQERIFINKFVYRIEPIQRGDIVVFRYPRDPQKSFIKRVIGVAGDHVRIVDGRVLLNGKTLIEDYVPQAYQDDRFVFGGGGAAGFLLRSRRPSQPVKRQPRLRPSGLVLYLRKGCLRILAGG